MKSTLQSFGKKLPQIAVISLVSLSLSGCPLFKKKKRDDNHDNQVELVEQGNNANNDIGSQGEAGESSSIIFQLKNEGTLPFGDVILKDASTGNFLGKWGSDINGTVEVDANELGQILENNGLDESSSLEVCAESATETLPKLSVSFDGNICSLETFGQMREFSSIETSPLKDAVYHILKNDYGAQIQGLRNTSTGLIDNQKLALAVSTILEAGGLPDTDSNGQLDYIDLEYYDFNYDSSQLEEYLAAYGYASLIRSLPSEKAYVASQYEAYLSVHENNQQEADNTSTEESTDNGAGHTDGEAHDDSGETEQDGISTLPGEEETGTVETQGEVGGTTTTPGGNSGSSQSGEEGAGEQVEETGSDTGGSTQETESDTENTTEEELDNIELITQEILSVLSAVPQLYIVETLTDLEEQKITLQAEEDALHTQIVGLENQLVAVQLSAELLEGEKAQVQESLEEVKISLENQAQSVTEKQDSLQEKQAEQEQFEQEVENFISGLEKVLEVLVDTSKTEAEQDKVLDDWLQTLLGESVQTHQVSQRSLSPTVYAAKTTSSNLSSVSSSDIEHAQNKLLVKIQQLEQELLSLKSTVEEKNRQLTQAQQDYDTAQRNYDRENQDYQAELEIYNEQQTELKTLESRKTELTEEKADIQSDINSYENRYFNAEHDYDSTRLPSSSNYLTDLHHYAGYEDKVWGVSSLTFEYRGHTVEGKFTLGSNARYPGEMWLLIDGKESKHYAVVSTDHRNAVSPALKTKTQYFLDMVYYEKKIQSSQAALSQVSRELEDVNDEIFAIKLIDILILKDSLDEAQDVLNQKQQVLQLSKQELAYAQEDYETFSSQFQLKTSELERLKLKLEELGAKNLTQQQLQEELDLIEQGLEDLEGDLEILQNQESEQKSSLAGLNEALSYKQDELVVYTGEVEDLKVNLHGIEAETQQLQQTYEDSLKELSIYYSPDYLSYPKDTTSKFHASSTPYRIKSPNYESFPFSIYLDMSSGAYPISVYAKYKAQTGDTAIYEVPKVKIYSKEELKEGFIPQLVETLQKRIGVLKQDREKGERQILEGSYHYLEELLQNEKEGLTTGEGALDRGFVEFVGNSISSDELNIEGISNFPYLESADATERLQEFIEKGKKFQYSKIITFDQEQNILSLPGVSIDRPFYTFSDTLSHYLYESRPGGEYDIKRSSYFQQEHIKDQNNPKLVATNQTVQINGIGYPTNELGNFFVGLNGNRAGLSLEEIENYGMAVEIYKAQKWGKSVNVEGEEYDQRFYGAGYQYGEYEKAGFDKTFLDDALNYLLRQAKNEDE